MPAVPSFEMVSSIPLLRMFHERAARAFYVDYLGFEMEWEHRFHETPDSPLYFQLRLAEAVIHLNAHAQPEDPPAEVRIPVRGIEAFFDYSPCGGQRSPRPRGGRSPAHRLQHRSQSRRSFRQHPDLLGAAEKLARKFRKGRVSGE